MARRLPILILLALTLAVAAGCGGGGGNGDGASGMPPDQWAATVCGALADWQTDLEERSQALSGEVVESATPEAAKDTIVVFLDDVIASTETMRGQIEDAGAPAVDQGGEIQGELSEGLNAIETAFEQARADVEAVPTNDPEAFQAALTEIGTTLQTRGEQIGNTLGEIDEKYEAPELSEALESEPACEGIGS